MSHSRHNITPVVASIYLQPPSSQSSPSTPPALTNLHLSSPLLLSSPTAGLGLTSQPGAGVEYIAQLDTAIRRQEEHLAQLKWEMQKSATPIANTNTNTSTPNIPITTNVNTNLQPHQRSASNSLLQVQHQVVTPNSGQHNPTPALPFSPTTIKQEVIGTLPLSAIRNTSTPSSAKESPRVIPPTTVASASGSATASPSLLSTPTPTTRKSRRGRTITIIKREASRSPSAAAPSGGGGGSSDEDEDDHCTPSHHRTPSSTTSPQITSRSTNTAAPPGNGKRGQGVSCHSCKSNKPLTELVFCQNKGGNDEKRRRCRKKFCPTCLKRSYSPFLPSPDTNLATWVCPSCMCMCLCANCVRRDQGADAVKRRPYKKRNSTIGNNIVIPIEQCIQMTKGGGGGTTNTKQEKKVKAEVNSAALTVVKDEETVGDAIVDEEVDHVHTTNTTDSLDVTGECSENSSVNSTPSNQDDVDLDLSGGADLDGSGDLDHHDGFSSAYSPSMSGQKRKFEMSSRSQSPVDVDEEQEMMHLPASSVAAAASSSYSTNGPAFTSFRDRDRSLSSHMSSPAMPPLYASSAIYNSPPHIGRQVSSSSNTSTTTGCVTPSTPFRHLSLSAGSQQPQQFGGGTGTTGHDSPFTPPGSSSAASWSTSQQQQRRFIDYTHSSIGAAGQNKMSGSSGNSGTNILRGGNSSNINGGVSYALSSSASHPDLISQSSMMMHDLDESGQVMDPSRFQQALSSPQHHRVLSQSARNTPPQKYTSRQSQMRSQLAIHLASGVVGNNEGTPGAGAAAGSMPQSSPLSGNSNSTGATSGASTAIVTTPSTGSVTQVSGGGSNTSSAGQTEQDQLRQLQVQQIEWMRLQQQIRKKQQELYAAESQTRQAQQQLNQANQFAKLFAAAGNSPRSTGSASTQQHRDAFFASRGSGGGGNTSGSASLSASTPIFSSTSNTGASSSGMSTPLRTYTQSGPRRKLARQESVSCDVSPMVMPLSCPMIARRMSLGDGALMGMPYVTMGGGNGGMPQPQLQQQQQLPHPLRHSARRYSEGMVQYSSSFELHISQQQHNIHPLYQMQRLEQVEEREHLSMPTVADAVMMEAHEHEQESHQQEEHHDQHVQQQQQQQAVHHHEVQQQQQHHQSDPQHPQEWHHDSPTSPIEAMPPQPVESTYQHQQQQQQQQQHQQQMVHDHQHHQPQHPLDVHHLHQQQQQSAVSAPLRIRSWSEPAHMLPPDELMSPYTSIVTPPPSNNAATPRPYTTPGAGMSQSATPVSESNHMHHHYPLHHQAHHPHPLAISQHQYSRLSSQHNLLATHSPGDISRASSGGGNGISLFGSSNIGGMHHANDRGVFTTTGAAGLSSHPHIIPSSPPASMDTSTSPITAMQVHPSPVHASSLLSVDGLTTINSTQGSGPGLSVTLNTNGSMHTHTSSMSSIPTLQPLSIFTPHSRMSSFGVSGGSTGTSVDAAGRGMMVSADLSSPRSSAGEFLPIASPTSAGGSLLHTPYPCSNLDPQTPGMNQHQLQHQFPPLTVAQLNQLNDVHPLNHLTSSNTCTPNPANNHHPSGGISITTGMQHTFPVFSPIGSPTNSELMNLHFPS